MVLYFLFPSPTVEDVKSPALIFGTHYTLKNFTQGMAAGIGFGILSAIRKHSFTPGTVKRDVASRGAHAAFTAFRPLFLEFLFLFVFLLLSTPLLVFFYIYTTKKKSSCASLYTLWMRNFGVLGLASGVPYSRMKMEKIRDDGDDLREKAFELQHDKGINRMHMLTLYGMFGGSFLASKFAAAHSFSALQGVSFGAPCLGGFVGFCMDFPLTVFIPIYISHVDDIPVCYPSLVGLPDDE